MELVRSTSIVGYNRQTHQHTCILAILVHWCMLLPGIRYSSHSPLLLTALPRFVSLCHCSTEMKRCICSFVSLSGETNSSNSSHLRQGTHVWPSCLECVHEWHCRMMLHLMSVACVGMGGLWVRDLIPEWNSLCGGRLATNTLHQTKADSDSIELVANEPVASPRYNDKESLES